MVNDDFKGILYSQMNYPVTSDLVEAQDVAEYLGSHTVEANVCARWQRSPNGLRLLDWKLHAISLDGQELSEEVGVPSDFPMQQIINAVTISSKMRRVIEGSK